MKAPNQNYSENIISMLCKDAPYAWFLFDQAKRNSRYSFIDFKEQAERLESYLDALSVAITKDQKIEDWLAPEDWGSCFVLSVLGIRHNKPELFDIALDNLNESEETHYREVVDACLWDRSTSLSSWLVKLIKHNSSVAQQSAIAISRSVNREMNPTAFKNFLENDNVFVRSQFFNWLGEHKQIEQLPLIQSYYNHSNSRLAFSAARAGLLLDDALGKQHLEKFALTENVYMLDAITLIFIKENNQQLVKNWVEKLWETDSISIRVKLHAISISGLPDYIDKIFQPMIDEETSRAAGEVFTTITGVDIENQNLDAEDGCPDCRDDEDEIDPSLAEKREEDPFISDWEDDLPYPCPDATDDWWQNNRHCFKEGMQHLRGLQTTQDNLRIVLKNGNQKQRELAALHLFIKYENTWIDCGWPPSQQNSYL